MLTPSATQEFERAIAELQQGLWVVKTEERYEPTFSYRWDLVDAWLPREVTLARRLSRAAAIDRLLARYLAGAAFASEAALARLFGLPRVDVATSLARLARAGRVRVGCEVSGWPGRWVVVA